jgi:hypothetical protein
MMIAGTGEPAILYVEHTVAALQPAAPPGGHSATNVMHLSN